MAHSMMHGSLMKLADPMDGTSNDERRLRFRKRPNDTDCRIILCQKA